MFAGWMDDEQVTIKLSQLTEHLACVLCRGMLRDAQTIPECLHSCECLSRIEHVADAVVVAAVLDCLMDSFAHGRW